MISFDSFARPFLIDPIAIINIKNLAVQSLSSQQVGCFALASAGAREAQRRHLAGVCLDLTIAQ